MPNHRFGPRTNARSQALQLLYQAEINNRTIDDVLSSDYVLSDGPLDEFGESLARGVAAQKLTLDAIIAQTANNWTIDRMPVVDRNLLRLALYEMLFVEEVATAVSIDEYVELSKAYGSDKSRRFINGLLGKVARQMDGGVDLVAQARQYAEEHPGFDDFDVFEPAEAPAQKREYEPYKGQLDEPDEEELEAMEAERAREDERRQDRDYDDGYGDDYYDEPYDQYDGYDDEPAKDDAPSKDQRPSHEPRTAQGSGEFSYDDSDGADDGYGTLSSASSDAQDDGYQPFFTRRDQE